MKKRFYSNKEGLNLAPLLSFLIPGGLIITLVILVVRWVKSQGGILQLFGNLSGISSLGSTKENNLSNAEMVDKATNQLKDSGVTITVMHTSLANSISTLLNQVAISQSITQIWSSVIPKDWQVSVLKILRNITLKKDVACVFVAFGSRPLSNRQHAILGFIWDDNPQNLREWIEKLFDGVEKIEALAIIEAAIKEYLS